MKNENGREKVRVSIDGVNFRCAQRLRKAVQTAGLKKVKRPANPYPKMEQRRDRMSEYLKQYGTINITGYAHLNGCSRYCAGKDMQEFEEEGLIASAGRTTHKVFLLVE